MTDQAETLPSRLPGERPVPAPLVADLARVTGLVLVVLLGVHVASVLVHDPADLDVGELIRRWEQPIWLLADWGLLLVGTAHAVLSLWARPPARRSDARLVVLGALSTLAVVLFGAASWGMLRLV